MSEHSAYQTLVDLLQARAHSQGAITFSAGQDKRQAIKFADLLAQATQRLAVFQAAGLKQGDSLIIQSSDNALFIEALWACFLGGIVAVPVAGGNSAEHRFKLFRIASMLDKPALFIDKASLNRLQVFADENDLRDACDSLSERVFYSDETCNDAMQAHIVEPACDDTAFIQFSSGSTSTPKGIVLTHKNLLINAGSIIDGCRMTTDDRLLSWMPLTHDMGLIGFHLTPLLCDCSHCLIPTDVFIRRPGIWLSETQAMKATILCSPNFGYQHLLKSFKPERYANELDLSSVRLLFNGAEPISVALCHEFMQTLAPFALAADSMIPVYGLAEASLAVTFPTLGKRFTAIKVERTSLVPGAAVNIVPEDSDGVHFVAVGKPVSHVQVLIRDDDNAACQERVTGRICIRGPNVTSGYFKEPELNAQLIDEHGWLDTGDLGFMHDNQLYITGRAKDIIFINGQNVYPHDLEEILIQRELVERGKCAVASYQAAGEHSEQLLVFVLHRGDVAELQGTASEITRVLSAEAGLRVDAVVAVPRIPKTTSGKVQRFQLLRDFAAGEFQVLRSAVEAPAGDSDEDSDNELSTSDDLSSVSDGDGQAAQDNKSQLLQICNSLIEGMDVSAEDNLFELGISSLTLAEIHAAIEDSWPDQVDITDLFDYPTVAELAAFLDAKT